MEGKLTVGELIVELQKFDSSWEVHLDISADEETGWEGDRVVRHLAGVRHQQGYDAVALDGTKESA